MASSLNSEFNYRYQVIGDTIWEKIKTLKGFLEGRVRAKAYPPMSDYLDGIVRNDTAQIQTYLSACLAVKQAYPK